MMEIKSRDISVGGATVYVQPDLRTQEETKKLHLRVALS